MLLDLYFQIRILLFLSLIAVVGSQFPQPQPYLKIWPSALTTIRNRTFLLKEARYLETVYNEFEHRYGAPRTTKMLRQRAEQLSSINLCKRLTKLGINEKCCSHTGMIFSSIGKKRTWALKMMDAFGKFPSGFMLGNIHLVGSYEECHDVKVRVYGNYSGHPARYRPFGPKYCQVLLPIKGEAVNGALVSFPAQYGVCVPDTCSSKDISTLVNNGIHLLPFSSTKNFSVTSFCEIKPSLDGKAIFSIVSCSLFLALLIFATLYHVTCHRDQAAPPKSAERSARRDVTINDSVDPSNPDNLEPDDLEHTDIVQLLPVRKEPSLLGKIFMCFSVYRNGAKLLNTSQAEATLSCVHGVRFLSMTWVLIGHVYAFSVMVISNPVSALKVMKGFAFQAIANALVSVDSFFLLSGLLVSYSTLRAMKANGGKMNWVYFYLHRFWRLTPPYMLLMMVYVPLFRYIGHGPFWPPQGFEKDFCKNSWFYNLFYINNFMPNASINMCMGWSWYLANDMQFYWISPLVIIPLYRSAKLGHVVALVLLLANFAATAVLATRNHSPITLIEQTNTDDFDQIYIKPYTRIGPYLIGILYGYHLYTNKTKKLLNGYISCAFWSMATISAVAVLYGIYNILNLAVVPQPVSVFYITVHRTVWGICLGWVIYACYSGFGGFVNTLLSWKALIPLSRLTYTAYLVHPIVLFYYFYSQMYPVYATQINLVFLIFGVMFVTFAMAFLLSMAFEAPMLGLEKLLLEKLRNRRK